MKRIVALFLVSILVTTACGATANPGATTHPTTAYGATTGGPARHGRAGYTVTSGDRHANHRSRAANADSHSASQKPQ